MNNLGGKKPPLLGIKVLDLSRVLAGPYCTQMMADLGAHVVKIEPPEGDETRGFGPPFVNGESTYFLSINRGKKSVAIDLKHSAGVAVIHQLALWADIVIENFRPGVADRLGIGYSQLAALNPRLIYASISGFGHRGIWEYSKLPSYDLVAQGIGGIPSLTGDKNTPPYKVGTSVADLVAGQNAFSALMVALWQRENTQHGAHLDISIFDGQVALLTYHASAHLNAHTTPHRRGNAHPNICPYETFLAADGYFNIACCNDTQFVSLVSVVGHAQLAEDPRFRTNPERVAHRLELLEILQPLLKTKTVQEWLTTIAAAGVPCGPVFDVPQALAHPQVQARSMIVTTHHPQTGDIRTVGHPLGFHQPENSLPPPKLGEHNQDVLLSVLGYSQQQIDDLYANNVLTSPERRT